MRSVQHNLGVGQLVFGDALGVCSYVAQVTVMTHFGLRSAMRLLLWVVVRPSRLATLSKIS